MAYQPIQGHGLDWSGEAFGKIADSLGQLGQVQRQRAMYEQQQRIAADERNYQRQRDATGDQRQRTADFQAAYVKAKALADAGDLEGAKAILAPYVTGLQQVDAPGQAPQQQAPGAAPVQAPRDDNERRAMILKTGGRVPVPPVAAQQPSRTPQMDAYARTVAGEVQGEGGRASDPLADEEALQFGNEIAGIVNPQPQQPPIMGVQSNNPIVRARQGEIALNQERARKLLQFRDPTGQALTLDPMSGENAQRAAAERMRAENLRVFDEVVSQMSPEEQRYAATMRPAVGMSREPLRGGDVLDYIASLRNKDTAASAQKAAEDERWRRQQERDALEHQRRLERDQKRPRPRGGGGGGGVRPTQDAASRLAVAKYLSDEVDSFAAKRGTKQAVATYRNLQDTYEKTRSANQGDRIGALYGFARAAEGGSRALTDADFQNIAKGIKGGKAEEVKQWFQVAESGDVLTPEVANMLAQGVENYLTRLRTHVAADERDYDARFGDGSEFAGLEGNVARKRIELFGAFDDGSKERGEMPASVPVGVRPRGRSAADQNAVRARRAKAAQSGIDLDRLADEIVGGAAKRR